MAELTGKEAACRKIAERMGNAGYCNYDACLEFIRELYDRAYDAGSKEQREKDAKMCRTEGFEECADAIKSGWFIHPDRFGGRKYGE